MADQVQAAGANASGGTSPSAEAGGKAGAEAQAAASGTPSSQGEGGKPARDPEERIKYLEAELKKVIGQRDKFLETDEGKELKAQAEKAKTYEAQQREIELETAKKRGEYQKLYEDQQSKNEELSKRAKEAERKLAEAEARHRTSAAKRDLVSAYKGLDGVDTETFDMLADRAIAEGKITVDEKTGEPKGVEEYLHTLKGAKPFLFRSVGNGADEKDGKAASKGKGAPAPGQGASVDPRNIKPGASSDEVRAGWDAYRKSRSR